MRKHYPLNSNGAEDAGQLPWRDGVPSTGTEGSYPGQALFTDVEAEILSAIDAAGLVRNGSDLTQLIQAASRGIWLGQFGGTATALTATLPNSAVIPNLQGGIRVRGIAASNYPGGGGTLTITGIGSAGTAGAYPLVGSDGSSQLPSGAWSVGQFLTFDIDASGNARFAAVNPAAAPIGKGLYTKQVAGTYTWTVPAGVYWVYATCVGAGGGGSGGPVSSSATTNGGGGGAGGAAQGWIAVTPGQVITFVVGAGGGGGAWQYTGYSGGSSSIAGAGFTATGGAGGAGGSAPSGGGGGAGSGGQINTQGGNGTDGNVINAQLPSGVGGSSLLGGGGRSASFYLAGVSNGRAPGSGGGGTYTNTQNTAGVSGGQGGNGADGYVSFQY